MPGKQPKQKTSVTLSAEANQLIDQLTAKLGVNKSGILEMAVRKLAQAEGIPSTGQGKVG